jgi:hypothetical protein
MNRIMLWTLAGALGLMASGPDASADGQLSVEQILDRYVAARGGAEAWHNIQTMGWTGHIESGPGGISKVPFLMLFQRPSATRFEVVAQGQRSVRIFDGSKGWKLTPVEGGLPTVKDYSAEEISFAHDAGGLDGPLFDPKAKGISVALQGMDTIEGHSAYHLKLTLPSGQVRHDWIDAQSFLELKYDRATHGAAGMTGAVSVYYRDYQPFNGLVIPLVMESGGPASKETDKMIIEKVALNPTLPASQFTKPNTPRKHNGIVIDTRPAALDGASRNP